MRTAHNITSIRQAHFEGVHLSEAPNAPLFGQEFYEAADKGYQQQKDAGFPERHERDLDAQQQRLSNIGRLWP